MNSFKYLIALVLLSTCSLSFSQTAEEPETLSLNSGTIDSQFEYIFKKSGNFKGTNGQPYEAVKRVWLSTLRNHVNDSLKKIRKDLGDTQAIVETQAKEISELKTNLSKTQGDLETTNSEKDSMSLFGLQMSKSGYNTLLWSIIAGLLAFLLFFIYKFKNSNAVTRQAKQNLEEIEEEFEEHRKTALDREQKVRRQLQDEINKQKKG
ncbi:tRNA (guanine-N1)-methyltransferase [Algibacter sp. 2305UL17-15]|uniref:tRNA (guanine-N1)-methyltransferase n=1 Tax=Algibacter sp. 2305UL17-15 TaxID=3231268 RepID=UPI0034574A52